MTSKTHVALGLAVGLIMLHNNQDANTYITISGACIGSLMPDLDTRKSDPSQIFPPVSMLIDKVTKHRGATHYTMPFILIILYYYYQSYPCFVMGIGSLSHTIIDEITLKVGIKCGSRGEEGIYWFLWICNMMLIVGMFVDMNDIIRMWRVLE